MFPAETKNSRASGFCDQSLKAVFTATFCDALHLAPCMYTYM